jgi:hypothetical protein
MKGKIRGVGTKASIAVELLGFLWERKLWWMIPSITVLLLFGLLIILTEGSALAPFIYTLF